MLVLVMGFSDQLRTALVARGWTHQQLADAMGVPLITVEDWIHGRHEPSGTRRRLLADVLGLAVFQLWRPEDIAGRLTLDQARLLINAHKTSAGRAVIRAYDPSEKRACTVLERFWLVERSGPSIYSVTNHGLDVREALL